jgi:S-formylglutathione hydrolase
MALDGPARFVTHTVVSDLVPSPASYTLVLPPTDDAPPGGWPLVLALHGGAGGDGFAEQLGRAASYAWAVGVLPPVGIVVPSSGRSFWMDARDGSARWETFVLGPLLADACARAPLDATPAGSALLGVSMGGMGALRIACKHPNRFAAVTALEPAIDAALEWLDIDHSANFLRNPKLYEQYFGSPVDEAFFRANNPPAIALANLDALRSAPLQLYLECGDEDSLGLYAGAEYLHRILYDNGVRHEYHLVRGADHVGASLGRRFFEALGFIGRVLRPEAPDRAVEGLRRLREQMEQHPRLAARMQERAAARGGPGRRRGRGPGDPSNRYRWSP